MAQVAESLLKGRQRERVHALLGGSLADFVDWEAAVAAEHPETASLHWHRQEPEWTCSTALGEHGHIRCDGHGAEKGSLICALAYFFEQFAHAALLADFPKPREPINAPKELAALRGLGAGELTPAHYLRWLVTLMGDMHQPLHWLREHDYGSEVQVMYKGHSHSLLSFWEDYLPQQLPPLPDQAVLDASFQRGQRVFWHLPPAMHFRNWARDDATAVCSLVYGAMEEGNANWAESPFQLEEELFQKWLKLADELTVVGGERLAAVLIDILRHEDHRHAYEQGQVRWHPWHMLRPNGFMKNAAVAVVVVPALLAGLWLHERAWTGRGFRFWGTHLKH